MGLFWVYLYICYLRKILGKQKVKKSALSKLALSRVANIKSYLLNEKKIKAKQVKASTKVEVRTSTEKTSNIDLKLSK